MKKKREEKIGADVTVTQAFAGKVVKFGNDPRIVLQSERYYKNQLNKFRDGEAVTVHVTNKRPKRTLAQNSYYWGVYLPLISEKTGEQNVERLHELFKGLFLTQGIVEVLGRKVRIKKSTTEMSVADFSDYIMRIQSETGIEAPPTENFGLEPLPKKKSTGRKGNGML